MKFAYVLVIVLSINLMLFLTQTSIAKINFEVTGIDDYNNFYNNTNTTLGSLGGESYTLPNPSDGLPDDEASVSPTTGNIFTDAISSIKNKLLESTGISFLMKVVNALPNFLGFLGLPPEIVWSLGALWHGLTLFLLIGFIMGR